MRPLAPDVTEGPRAEILHCIEGSPGIHLRRVERETALSLGQVLYHLDRLERMGLVISARDAGFRRFYPARDTARGDKRFLAALRHEVPRRVLLQLLVAPRMSHKELLARVGVAASTLSFHLQRLLAGGVVLREREGTTNHYAITEPETVRRALIFYRESFHDVEVDKFVRAELARLAPPDDEAVRVPIAE